LGAECNAAFASREEAARERPECEIEQVEGWVGTGMLQSYANWAAPVSPVFVEEFALMAHADQVLGLDGVWWDDALDIGALSAPRGGLFRPAEWRIEEAPSVVPPGSTEPGL